MKSSHKLLVLWKVFFVSIYPNLAQSSYQEKIDSLLLTLPSVLEDTNKVQIYRGLSWNYAGIRSETVTARAYADSMQMLSEKLNYEKGIIQAHMCYGVCDRYEGKYTEALKHFNTYLDFCKRNGDEGMEALGWFQLATVHQELGNFDLSMAACENALSIHEKKEDWNGVVATLNSIGIIYKRIGKLEQAIEHYKKAIVLNDSFNLNRDLTFILMNTGNAYGVLKDYDKALEYYQKSLDVSYASNNDYGIASNLTNSGSVYSLMQQYQKSLDVHLQALEIWRKSPNKTKLAMSLLETGNTYIKLKNFTLAREHLEEGLELSKEMKTKLLIRDAYQYLTELYAAIDDFKQAYAYGNLYNEMKDSIFSEDIVKQINELQTKYETSEKDKQIVLLATEKELKEKEAQRQSTLKKAFISGFILVALLAASIFYSFTHRLKSQNVLAAKNEEINAANFKQQLGELELKALRAQINPHFLFNCMNSINRMILNGESDNASRYLTKFSKLVRLILENSEADAVSLENELAVLESYIQLEALRFKGKIDYKIEVDKSIDPGNTFLPSMVLQPFVENAIWHGLMHRQDEGEGIIKIIIAENEDQLQCVIEDNGIGRAMAQKLQEKSMLKPKSMGMKITEERLRLLSKDRLQELIKVIDLKDSQTNAIGTRVEVNIPLV